MLALASICALAAGAALGHHAISAFDVEREERVDGTITAFEWVNPHTEVRVESAAYPGEILRFEGMSPDYLGHRGWSRLTLKAGDRAEIVFFPHRDGSPGGLFVRARLADGTVRVMVDNDGL